jgi:hypothetical protein
MRFLNSAVPWVVIAVAALVVGCESLATAAADLAQRNVSAGIWTPEEGADFLTKAAELRTTAETLWGHVLTVGGGVITSVLASYGIIMKKRGPTEAQRVVAKVTAP